MIKKTALALTFAISVTSVSTALAGLTAEDLLVGARIGNGLRAGVIPSQEDYVKAMTTTAYIIGMEDGIRLGAGTGHLLPVCLPKEPADIDTIMASLMIVATAVPEAMVTGRVLVLTTLSHLYPCKAP
jgi:hypothetical protein